MVKVKTEPDDSGYVEVEAVALAVTKKKNNADHIDEMQECLVSEISALKTSNNEMFYELQKTKESLKLLESENEKLKSTNSALRDCDDKLKSTENQVAKLKSEVHKIKLQLDTSERDNRLLQARCEEFQKGIYQNQTSDNQSEKEEANGIYEVEQILDHKMKRKTRLYLVRWAKYDPSHDSWVTESNLNCSEILKKYKKLRKIN